MKWLELSPAGERSQPGARVLRQLVEAMLFEGLLEPHYGQLSRSWQPLRFRAGIYIYCCVARTGAFGRVRIQPGSLQPLSPAPQTEANLWRGALAALKGGSHAAMARLDAELEQTVMLCRWNLQYLGEPSSRRGLPFGALESALDEGHPYHPCFKARTGFTVADHRRYGPECGQGFFLIWLAVRRSRLRQSLPDSESTFWQRELGEEYWYRLRAGFNRLGLEWAGYAALPVHPWQWQSLGRGRLKGAIGRDDILYLGAFGDRYRATQTVRTLRNETHPDRSAIKLPLAMTNTSAERTLPSHSVAIAPALSAWLQQTVARDSFFTDEARMIVLAEYAGQIYQPRAGEDPRLADHLGALWRENVSRYLQPGESAVPFNALMATETDNDPFIETWVRRYGVGVWLDRLLHCAVLPVWHLLAAHGIALEAHAQNMILVHRDGWPVGIALRDFHESVEYVDDFLAHPQTCPDFGRIDPVYCDAPPGRYLRMGSVEALRELVMDTLFVFNLAELSFLFEEAYGVAETGFWSRVKALLDAYAAAGHTDPERIGRLCHEAPSIRSEALLSRKLGKDPGQECHHCIANEFAIPARKRPEHPRRQPHQYAWEAPSCST